MTRQGQNSVLRKQIVVVRAYGDEPVEMQVVGVQPNGFVVARAGQQQTIALPRDLVYREDKKLVRELRSAYRKGDHPRLRKLWSEMRTPAIGSV